MSWSGAVAGMNDMALATFGQPITVTVGTVASTLTGIVDAPYSGGQDPMRGPFARPDHRVAFRSTQIAATSAKPGDRITVDGRDFYIADLQPDDGGMTEVTVRPA